MDNIVVSTLRMESSCACVYVHVCTRVCMCMCVCVYVHMCMYGPLYTIVCMTLYSSVDWNILRAKLMETSCRISTIKNIWLHGYMLFFLQ